MAGRRVRRRVRAFLAAALITLSGPATAAEAQQLDKTGADSSSGDTQSVPRGGTIDWVVSATNPTGAPADVTIADVIQGAGTVQELVPGSLVVPPGFTPGWSTDGGVFFEATDQGTATNAVGAHNPSLQSPATAVGQILVPPLRGLVQPTGGDGLIPILYTTDAGDPQIWNLYHHIQAQIVCTDVNMAAPCPGGPWPKHLSSTPGPFGTGSHDVYSVTANMVVADPSDRHIVWETVVKTSTPASMGQLCIDLEAQATCGYTALGSFPGAVALAHAEPVLVGTKIYTPRPGTQRIFCFDTAVAVRQPCPGQPYVLPAAVGNGFAISPAVDGKVYGFVQDFGPVTFRMEAWCFDPVTNAACAGWSSAKLVLSSSDPFHPYGPRFATFDPAGNPTGVCFGASVQDAPAPFSFAFECYDPGGTVRSAPPAIQWLDSTIVDLGFVVSLEALPILAPNGHVMTFFPLWQQNVANRNGAALCYDWTTASPCAATTTGSPGFLQWPNVNNGTTRDYGYAYDGRCMYGLGDAGRLWSFDPVSGSSPCGRTQTRITLDPAPFYCDGKAGHAQAYDAVTLADIDLSTVDFTRTSVTITDTSGTVLGTFSFDPATGRAGISAVPVTAMPIVAVIDLAVFDASSFTDANQPKGVVSFLGDAPQMCFSTTVIADCSATSVANSAAARYVGITGVNEIVSPTVTFAISDDAEECVDEPPRPPKPTPTPVVRPIAFTG